MAGRFKFLPSLPVSYADQGDTYFTCLRYTKQTDTVKRRIDRICKDVSKGNEQNAKALKEFLTTRRDFQEICGMYYLSPATLDRLRKSFYLRYDQERRSWT